MIRWLVPVTGDTEELQHAVDNRVEEQCVSGAMVDRLLDWGTQ